MSENIDPYNAQAWRWHITDALGAAPGNRTLTVEQAIEQIEKLKANALSAEEPDKPFVDHVPDESKIVDGKNFRRLGEAVAQRARADKEVAAAMRAMLADGDSPKMISLAMGQAGGGGRLPLSEILQRVDEFADRLEKGEYSIGAVVSGVDVRNMQDAVRVLLEAGATRRFIRDLAGL